MATEHPKHKNSIELIERQHPEWCRQFDPAERQHMLREDSKALGTMSLEFVSIVILGFVMVALTVVFIVFCG